MDEVIAPFRARARILALLGDQLIGSDQLAIFELVKNSYDADASTAIVQLRDVDTDDPFINVEDDGDGMSLATIKDIWLEPASDHRETQRQRKERTRIYGRLPLGEKGVGRFAVHKLGRSIKLITRPRGTDLEHRVEIDWDALTKVRYLDETRIRITTKTPSFFVPEKNRKPHGTRIIIGGLRKKEWKRGEARQLYRSITAISSPFDTGEAFRAELVVPDHPEWISEMPDVHSLLEMAPWRFDFSFNGRLTWSYEFRSPSGIKVEGRTIAATDDDLLLEKEANDRSRPVGDASVLRGIGAIRGSFIAFDRDRKVLALLPQITLVKDFLDQQGGIRIYRDGVRVYNYGEPSDDWLRLDLRRVNRPAQRLSKNIVIGAINLSLEESTGLREKTNREGFDETEVFERFQRIVTSIVHKFEVERALDKERLKNLLDGKTTSTTKIPVETTLQELRSAVLSKQGEGTLIPLIDRVEQEYYEMRDLLLRAGLTGLNLGMVIHEVERGIRGLYESAKGGASAVSLEKNSRDLMGLVENVAGLLRNKTRGPIDLRKIIQNSAEINIRRYKRHQVKVTYDLPELEMKLTGSPGLMQNVLLNLIDNSIYWLRVRWPDIDEGKPELRRLHIGITTELPGGFSIVVSDNGPGFSDVPDVITKPFFTRRPDGIGLGLYYASLSMSLSGGSLLFPDRDDLDLPNGLDGAVVAMFFPGPSK